MKKLVFFLASTGLILVGVFFLRFKLNNKNAIIKEEENQAMTIRKSAFAGQFYPADQNELQSQINKYLSNSEFIINKSELINILIVPHAGYKFSGAVAAAGYKQLKNQNIDRIILLGNSHQSFFDGVAIDDRNQWETPLGQVETDQKLIEKLCSHELIDCNPQPHNQEHSLEVQLPLLQSVLTDFKIIPILLGQINNKTLDQLTSILKENLGPNTLVIISTDLSHYPNYEIATQVDNQTIESILSGKPENFEKTINNLMGQNYPNLQTCACAAESVKIGLNISQDMDGQWQKIKYANSGDVTGDKSQVVGYASLVFSQEKDNGQSSNAQNQELNEEQKGKLLAIARKSLEKYLTNEEKPAFEVSDPALQSKLGVFVTLNKNDQLRGCMGNFSPDTPLWQTVQEQTITAASKDPRFPAVEPEELEDIEIEISVLSKPKEIDNWQNIKLGKHGVLVRKGNRSGTYLPQVGTEHQWDGVEEFLSHLCLNKAGLNPKCYLDKDTDLLTYTADVFSE